VFYFILPHYVEKQTQFGLLHRDLTPRPSFLAMAAAGRFLAGARPLGRLQADDPGVQAYVFEARPDGRRAKVLVAWSQEAGGLELPEAPQAVFDHLGRAREVAGGRLKLGPAPQFAVLKPGTHLVLTPPPARPAVLPGRPSPIVLQAVLPETSILLRESAYKLPAGQVSRIPIFAYNFGDRRARGRLAVTAPEPWRAELPAEVEIGPGERKELSLSLTARPAAEITKARITGDFGPAGRPVLSLRFQVPGKGD
jgi:hypothetical protein